MRSLAGAAARLAVFNGEDFTRASAGVSFAVAVPEPASAGPDLKLRA